MDKLNKYCETWKLNINLKKTKIIIFNRGNRLIKSEFKINNVVIENVKSIKYLGFTTAKNCSFLPTLEDLSIKANRAIYTLNTKIKISRFPTKVALKLFNTLIKPILLYGSEVWGSYTGFDYTTWDRSKTEMTHTQFLKRALGCNIHSSNIMSRGEVGARPLLIDIIKRIISYIKNINERRESIVYSAYEFELKNDSEPNLKKYINNFNLSDGNEILEKKKNIIKEICRDNYDRCWCTMLVESPKANSYIKFKNRISLEKYLSSIQNVRHRIALTRVRLSNHNLIEK